MIAQTEKSTSIKDILAELEVEYGPAVYVAQPESEPLEHTRAFESQDNTSAKLMIVDDEPINVKVARKYLQTAGYKDFITVTDSRKALELIATEQPDALLLDIMMPEVSGLDILREMRADESLARIPVIILTASTDREMKLKALEIGATDFLNKPVDPAELLPRIRNALIVKAHYDHLDHYAHDLEQAVRKRTAELVVSRLEVVHCLARAAEFRDDVTGKHVYRVGRYAGIIGRELGMPENGVHLLEMAAQLHDVGKIGIPDGILLKPDKLTPDEYDRMQKHCGFGKRIFDRLDEEDWQFVRRHPQIGGDLLDAARSPLIRMAARVALTHHERWDGKGYPLGLAGTDIPLEGRITAVADVFDALSSKRPYKPAFSIEKCIEILEEGRGTQFDVEVLDAFFNRREEIIAVQIEYADTE